MVGLMSETCVTAAQSRCVEERCPAIARSICSAGEMYLVGYNDLIELARLCLLQASARGNLRSPETGASDCGCNALGPSAPGGAFEHRAAAAARDRGAQMLTLHAEAPVIVRRAHRSLGHEVSYLAQIGRGDDATVPNGNN
jgi:hypothetical protein